VRLPERVFGSLVRLLYCYARGVAGRTMDPDADLDSELADAAWLCMGIKVPVLISACATMWEALGCHISGLVGKLGRAWQLACLFFPCLQSVCDSDCACAHGCLSPQMPPGQMERTVTDGPPRPSVNSECAKPGAQESATGICCGVTSRQRGGWAVGERTRESGVCGTIYDLQVSMSRLMPRIQ